MTPLISLITVTYNAGTTLERTLRSVEEQTYVQIEHLIIDGASTDDTLAVAQTYKERIDDMYEVDIVSEPDHGLYDAMNKGLRRAHGKYVCFLNAGDRLHSPDTLECIAEADASQPDSGVIYGDTDIVDDHGTFLHHRRLHPVGNMTWQSFRRGMLICHQSFYARRALCTAYNLQYRYSADFDWCVRVMRTAAEQGMGITDSHRILTDYLDEGMTTRNHRASLRERFGIMSRHYGLLSTVACHVWFVIRGLLAKLQGRH